MRIRIQGDEPHTISIELGRNTRDNVLWRRRDDLLAAVQRRSLLKVDMIEMRVTFDPEPNAKKGKSRKLAISAPGTCSLEFDTRGLLIERMLAEHGIELKRPQDDPNADTSL